MAQERCPYCGQWYAVHPRLWGRQKTCGDAACRAKHKAALNREWRERNPEKQKERNKAVTERRGLERYWNEWRSDNPDYVERNREQTRERMRRLRAVRRESEGILKDPMGYLEGLRSGCGEMFATQEPIGGSARRSAGLRPTMFATQESIFGLSVGLWTYLRAQAVFATGEGIAAGAGEGV